MRTPFTRTVTALAAIIICTALAGACGNRAPKTRSISEFITPLDSIELRYSPALAAGSMAPDFAVPDTLGASFSLSDFEGSYLVLDFWASWCGDCRREIPELKALYEDTKNLSIDGCPVRWLGVSFDHDADAWKSLLRKEQFAWPQVSNLVAWKQNPVSEAYGLQWIPTMYLIGPDGTVVCGCITAARLREAIEIISK